MKNKIKLFGIALVSIIGFSFVACDNGNNPGGSNPTPIAISMVQITGGTFTMGSPESEPGRYSEETQRQVTLSGFSISKYPVTQGQYETVMGTNPSYFQVSTIARYTGTVNHPVERVSWYDAIVFCNKLSMSEGLSAAYRINGSTDPTAWGTVPTNRDTAWDVEIVVGSNGYRLPTEAQWEYACRAGTTTAFNWGTNTISSSQANYGASSVDANNTVEGTSLDRTTAVGSYAANAWGLYDMHGNVWEWCWDWYGSYPSEAQTNPIGAGSSESPRVRRGGAWSNSGKGARSAYRFSYHPFVRSYSIGFRLALTN
jgi:formylglycine-generating enzyme required for sulfatase activity